VYAGNTGQHEQSMPPMHGVIVIVEGRDRETCSMYATMHDVQRLEYKANRRQVGEAWDCTGLLRFYGQAHAINGVVGLGVRSWYIRKTDVDVGHGVRSFARHDHYKSHTQLVAWNGWGRLNCQTTIWFVEGSRSAARSCNVDR
jgi:hypothetical protein